MEISANAVSPYSRSTLSKCLNALIADKYILMNKTALLLQEVNTPSIQQILEETYADLRVGVAKVLEFARSNEAQVPLSINSFIQHTRLQANIPLQSVESFIEQLVNDYNTTIKNTKEDSERCHSERAETDTLFVSIARLLNKNVSTLHHCLSHLHFNQN